MNQDISSEKIVIKEVLNDINELININKKYSACEWSPAGDEERNRLVNEYKEIKGRISNQFTIHSIVVKPERNGQSNEWASLQQYVSDYFNGPTSHNIPTFDAYRNAFA